MDSKRGIMLLGAVAFVVSGCSGSGKAITALPTSSPKSTSSTSSTTSTSLTTVVPDGSAGSTSTTSGSPGVGSAPLGTEAPTVTTAPSPSGPVFTAFTVVADACPSSTPAPDVSTSLATPNPRVTVTWKITGPYDSVYDAVDNPDGPYHSGLPSSGTDDFSRSCNGSSHTYYVVAVSGGRKTVRSTVVASG